MKVKNLKMLLPRMETIKAIATMKQCGMKEADTLYHKVLALTGVETKVEDNTCIIPASLKEQGCSIILKKKGKHNASLFCFIYLGLSIS